MLSLASYKRMLSEKQAILKRPNLNEKDVLKINSNIDEIKKCIEFVQLTNKKKRLIARCNTSKTKQEQTEFFNKAQEVHVEQREKLVPLSFMNYYSMEIYFANCVSDLWCKIEILCKKWYNTAHVEKHTAFSCTNNLEIDLDYIFTQGVTLIGMVGRLGFNIKKVHSFNHFKDMYIRYEEEGLHSIIGYNVDAYNWKKKRPFTQKELDKRNEYLNSPETKAMIDDILKEVLEKKTGK